MYSLLFLGTVSFVLALFLTPLVRTMFRRWGLAHRVDARHSVATGDHGHLIPRAGGVAIVVSYLLAYALLLTVPLNAGFVVWDSLNFVLRLMPAAGIIFLIGLLDDIRGL